MTIDALLSIAILTHGQLYADLLRADIEIARRRRDTGTIPQAWLAKRRRMGRAYDAELARFEMDLLRARREFWKSR